MIFCNWKILAYIGRTKECMVEQQEMTIEEHPFLQDVPGVTEHFWNMFVIDALIGNTDRNNSNWGIIVREDGAKEIAPVYDNGNCLNENTNPPAMLGRIE